MPGGNQKGLLFNLDVNSTDFKEEGHYIICPQRLDVINGAHIKHGM